MIPGETALAFYTVKNKTDKAILGVATYNVHPPKAGLYFNKIQCFCFDEQRLKPREEIDMPVRTYVVGWVGRWEHHVQAFCSFPAVHPSNSHPPT